MSKQNNSDKASLAQLTKNVIAFRDARDWKQFHTIKDMLLSLSLEVAELSEHFQWKDQLESIEYIQTAKEEVGDELSDVLYWVLLIAHDLEVDLETAFHKKMLKNQRKYPVAKSRGEKSKYTARD